MKYVYLFTAAALLATTRPAAAQTASAALDANNILGPVYANAGYLWNNPGFTIPGFQVPRIISPGQPARSTVFSASLWMGGQDASGNLYVAAETYRQGNPAQRGFWSGPMATQFAQPGDDPAYSFVWKVTRAQITAHRANHGQPGYQTPPELLNWPARPAGYTGISALAPFVDTNANGYYDPQAGDYPDVPGDQAIFFIVNDAAGSKEPYSPAMGVEVQGLAYAFDFGTCNPAVDNTVFVRYQFTNHSTRTYHDTYLGHYVDFDLGYFNDDYVGCDTIRQMAYAYNGDPLDDGVTGYGFSPPAQAVVSLGRRLDGFQYYNNDFSIQGNPTATQHYYEYLQGHWKDGRTVRYGGDGLANTSGLTPTRFMFSGDPVTGTGWTEGHPGPGLLPNTPADRRGLLTFGPFTFQPGEVRTLNLAYVFGQDNGPIASVAALRTAVDQLQVCIANGLLATTPDAPEATFTLSPNPAHGTVRVTLAAAQPAGQTVQLLDALGRVVRVANFELRTSNCDISGLPAGLYTVRCGTVAKRLIVE